MGHGGEGRISVQPLPNVGYRHADGRIRRVLLVAPECVDEDVWRSVVSRLPGAPLIAEASGEAVSMLAPLAGPDPMLARYRGEGRWWPSATPVVVPGYNSLRGRLRPERSVRRLLRHAGIAEALLERAAFARGSRLGGSAHPLSYRRPGHLARYPCMHLSVEWTVPVRNPLALGAGVGCGLGLLVPVGEEFLCSSRGDVEGSGTDQCTPRRRWNSLGSPDLHGKFVLNFLAGSQHSLLGHQLSLAFLQRLGAGFGRHRAAL